MHIQQKHRPVRPRHQSGNLGRSTTLFQGALPCFIHVPPGMSVALVGLATLGTLQPAPPPSSGLSENFLDFPLQGRMLSGPLVHCTSRGESAGFHHI